MGSSVDSAPGTPSQRRRRRAAAFLRIDKLPDYLRDTMHWIIGMSLCPPLERRNSEELEGCCLAKILISNILSLTSRSRRKDNKDSKRRVASASQVPPRPVRKSPSSSELCVCESIGDETIERFVALPPGIDRNEWIATNVIGLFDNANALCGTVSELCTPVTCPHMSFPGTSKAQYVDEKGKRHVYSAMQYIDCVMSFTEKTTKDEAVFPTRHGAPFRSTFEPNCRLIAKYLWHCMGHLYTRHWEELDALNLRPQTGLVIAHLARFCSIFGLLEPKDQQMLNSTTLLVRPPPPPPSIQADFMATPSSDHRVSRVPNSKSGSWGGYPSPAVLSCKSYAQTC